MTPNPVTVDARSSVRAVMRRLLELDVRHLPVVEDRALVGIVSDRDLRDVMARLVTEGATDVARVLDGPIADVMSADVLTVDEETDLGEVVDLMIEHRIGAVPVVAPDSSELVGIVSYVDVLRAARDGL